MLQLFYRLNDLNFGKLMAVYAESNAMNAKEQFGGLEFNTALLEVESSFYQYLREDFFCVPEAVYAVWAENGIYVAALRLEPYKDGLLLEALETHPEYRRMGFASKLIRRVQEYLKQRGDTAIYSHVSKRNSVSLRTHLSCGFQRVSEQAVYVDGSVTQMACTLKYVVRS